MAGQKEKLCGKKNRAVSKAVWKYLEGRAARLNR